MMAVRTVALWTLLRLVLAARVRNSRSTAGNNLVAVPDETVADLEGLFKKRAYRYVIAEVPHLKSITGERSKNYADFKQQLMACTGVCVGFYDFAWQAPRGGGFVDADEPAMYTWAPDDRPAGLGMMAYMRLKMALPNIIKDFKTAISFNGAVIQANSEPFLLPEHVVPKLKGGRLGNRWENLNDSGMALGKQLKAELAGGATGGAAVVPVSPPGDGPAPSKPGNPTPVGPTPVNPNPPRATATVDMAKIERIIDVKVDKILGEKEAEIMSKAQAAAVKAVEDKTDARVKEVAQEAAMFAVKDAFESSARNLK